jgi:hypothetical protein
MATSKQLNYSSRDFLSIREDLINYVKQYYPDSLSDFTENDLGVLFIELIAGLGDSLNYQINRRFQETQLEFAQERRSIFSIAKNMGLKVPNKRGSVTIVSFTFTVPVLGDTYDSKYLPILKAGTQVVGGGQVFELRSDVDFDSDTSALGFPNRTIKPNISADEKVLSYDITKSEVVYNGITRIFSRSVTSSNYKPFLSFNLPETDIIQVDQIIVLPGLTNPDPVNADFYDSTKLWYEVDYLLQDRIFKASNNNSSLKTGVWDKVTKKFITEFTHNGLCKITFGGGNGDYDLFNTAMTNGGVYNGLDGYLNNTAFGEIPPINSQIWVKYRTGGGIGSNLGSNVLTSVGAVFSSLNGPLDEVNQKVLRTLKVTNIIPALGGADAPSTEEVRNIIPYNFSAQNRCITLSDYSAQLFKMPSEFGVPFRNAVFKENNKVVVSILGIDSAGKLDNTSTSVLEENIAQYLSQFRSVNDYVEVRNGKIINIGFAFDLFIEDNVPSNQIVLACQKVVSDFFNINNNKMNNDVFIGSILKQLNAVVGVIDVINYKVYNKVGGQYSLNEIEQPYVNNDTREIELIDNAIYSPMDGMFEIKYPNSDIVFNLKKRTQLSR